MSSEIAILRKKNNNDEKNFKSDEEIKFHFMLRLQERYDIFLTDDEYNELHNPLGFAKSQIIESHIIHWAKISSSTSAFIIKIKNKLVLTIYSNRRGRFITALPWESHCDETRLVPKSLKKLGLKDFAINQYNEILSICSKEFVDLGNPKDNWYYYEKNCTYPGLMWAEYKGGLTIGRIYDEVIKQINKKENDLIDTI
jgi:hypothetical protein